MTSQQLEERSQQLEMRVATLELELAQMKQMVEVHRANGEEKVAFHQNEQSRQNEEYSIELLESVL
jgi:hypothetical protein